MGRACGAVGLTAGLLAGLLASGPAAAAPVDLVSLYEDLHRHPELAFQEVRSAAILAAEARAAGFEVTEKVGRTGVVAVLRNGKGPTVLIRADMDGLPVKETTGLSYASRATGRYPDGPETPLMHACGHDIHMAVWVGTARWLAEHRKEWRGTVVMVGQPAEDAGGGARAMLADGLLSRFPKPDFALALHDDSRIPAGTVTAAFVKRLGKARVVDLDPSMASEDFQYFGLEAKVPSVIYWLGGVPQGLWEQIQKGEARMPSLHNSAWAPDPAPTIATGVETMTAAVATLLPAR